MLNRHRCGPPLAPHRTPPAVADVNSSVNHVLPCAPPWTPRRGKGHGHGVRCAMVLRPYPGAAWVHWRDASADSATSRMPATAQIPDTQTATPHVILDGWTSPAAAVGNTIPFLPDLPPRSCARTRGGGTAAAPCSLPLWLQCLSLETPCSARVPTPWQCDDSSCGIIHLGWCLLHAWLTG